MSVPNLHDKQLPVYLVSDDVNSVYCYVRAESRGKAKQAAIAHDESDSLEESGFLSLRSRRMPVYDNSLTVERLVRDGNMWTECQQCSRQIDRYFIDDEEGAAPVFASDGFVFCSAECQTAWVARNLYLLQRGPMPIELDGICLYLDI